MMRIFFTLSILAGLYLSSHTIYAQNPTCENFKLDPAFADGMVLRRHFPLIFSGTCLSGSVRIDFAEESVIGTCQNGRYRIIIAPRAGGGPYKMRVSNHNCSITLNTIWIGEVWIAAGQSNMAGSSPRIHVPAPVQDLRLFHPFAKKEHGWSAWTNDIEFSVTALSFAKTIHERLKVPVGIIDISQNGSRISQWLEGGNLNKRWEILKTISVSGIIWWQGESDANDTRSNICITANSPVMNDVINCIKKYAFSDPGIILIQLYRMISETRYGDSLLKLIDQVRMLNSNSDLAFLAVGLQNYLPSPSKSLEANRTAPEDFTWSETRLAQNLILKIKNTAVIATYDVSDGSLHPENTRAVAGERLAFAALAKFYKSGNFPVSPWLSGIEKSGDFIYLKFNDAPEGLTTADGSNQVAIEISVDSESWHTVTANILYDRLRFRSDKNVSMMAVRFGHGAYIVPTLFGSNRMPALPFYQIVSF